MMCEIDIDRTIRWLAVRYNLPLPDTCGDPSPFMLFARTGEDFVVVDQPGRGRRHLKIWDANIAPAEVIHMLRVVAVSRVWQATPVPDILALSLIAAGIARESSVPSLWHWYACQEDLTLAVQIDTRKVIPWMAQRFDLPMPPKHGRSYSRIKRVHDDPDLITVCRLANSTRSVQWRQDDIPREWRFLLGYANKQRGRRGYAHPASLLAQFACPLIEADVAGNESAMRLASDLIDLPYNMTSY